MDVVLGLSLTTTAVRWVVVAGTTGEGEPIDRGELDIPDLATLDADLLVHAVLNPDVIAEERIRVVGVTGTRDAEPAAAAVRAAFEAAGVAREFLHDLLPGARGGVGVEVVALEVGEPFEVFSGGLPRQRGQAALVGDGLVVLARGRGGVHERMERPGGIGRGIVCLA